MKKSIFIFTILLYGFILHAQVEMPLDSLNYQFENVKKICDKDGGRLWGRTLYGPMLVIDKTSGMIVANQPDQEGRFRQQGEVYIGKYPKKSIVACTATEFAGTWWAVVSWPFDAMDSFDLYCTYIHESFHRIQGELGLHCSVYDNSHMDQMNARIYLNLEWLALLNAIDTSGAARTLAITDALLFRQHRRQLFAGADSMENRFELHEGLADYTAFKLCSNSGSELKERILQRKSVFLNTEGSCVRAFGYYSGLLYAYLLDETGAPWKTTLTCGDDLGLLLQRLSGIDLSGDTAHGLDQAQARYPYEKIYNQELDVNNKKEIILSDFKTRFMKDPVLIIDLIKPAYGIYMSPRPLDTIGTVYPVIDISDTWGFLKVTEKGCLIASDKAIVTAGNIHIGEQVISGDGWNLELNTNWTIVKQDDNYLVKEKINPR